MDRPIGEGLGAYQFLATALASRLDGSRPSHPKAFRRRHLPRLDVQGNAPNRTLNFPKHMMSVALSILCKQLRGAPAIAVQVVRTSCDLKLTAFELIHPHLPIGRLYDRSVDMDSRKGLLAE
jgi:hypothetical protein